MRLIGRLVAVAALVAVGAWAWTILFPSPERVIHRRLEAVARDASFAPNQGYLTRLARAQALTGFFATNVELNLDIPGLEEHRLTGRDEILQAALGERVATRGVNASFPDIHIVVSGDKKTAVADVTLVAKILGENDPMAEALKLTLENIEGKWLIRRVDTVRPEEN